MREQSPEIKLLFQKYLSGRYSTEDLKALLQYFELEDAGALESLIAKQFEKPLPEVVDQEKVGQLVRDTHVILMKEIRRRGSERGRRMWYAWATVAAMLFMVMGIGLYFYSVRSNSKDTSSLVSQFGADVAPGGNKAYITFSTGEKIALDSNQIGVVNEDGTYKYVGGDELVNTEAESAIVSTPNGGTFQVTLPDGSKAWLNAQSSIKYPNHFSDSERIVEITGEVYLDVNPDKDKPFIVYSNQQRIKVLGTAFNVRAYGGQSITTLVHGKVVLTNTKDDKPYVLSPGDQAKLMDNNITIKKVNTEDYLQWKEGIILLRDASLQETCAELERWYDVKFIFPAAMKSSGKALNSINRTEMLSSVLVALKNTYEVDFVIKGKEVFVK